MKFLGPLLVYKFSPTAGAVIGKFVDQKISIYFPFKYL